MFLEVLVSIQKSYLRKDCAAASKEQQRSGIRAVMALPSTCLSTDSVDEFAGGMTLIADVKF
jgi:hypothetical protein